MTPGASWPFDQAPNVAAFTLRQIVEGRTHILRVTHDSEDDGWQFLDGNPVTTADAMLVRMSEIVSIDGSVKEVAHMQPGHVAVREFVGGEWTISVQDPRVDDDEA